MRGRLRIGLVRNREKVMLNILLGILCRLLIVKVSKIRKFRLFQGRKIIGI